MLDECFIFSKEYDLKFNVKKCSYLRVGARYNKEINDFTIGTDAIKYTNSIVYLGVCIKSGKKLVFSSDIAKINFYRSFNSILHKCASMNNEIVLVHLLKSVCIPILLYIVEASTSVSDSLKSLDRCIFLALSKIFHTYSLDNINLIRGYFDIPPVKEIINKRRDKYYMSLVEHSNFKCIFQSGAWLLF